MIQGEGNSIATPQFSIVIPVYDDWILLRQCLQSLADQTNEPSFEVVIVDDGSREPAPEFVFDSTRSHPLRVIRQSHSGIPAARNRGIGDARGSLLLFVDADCRLESTCLHALSATIADSPEHDFFQLRLVGDRSTLAGRAEELRLVTFQNHTLQPDGRIRYLNTAGFAIRLTRAHLEGGVFDPLALRAEDTLLLANLMQRGKLPLFVPGAIVEHSIPRSLLECIRKDIRSVYLEGRAYDIIESKGVRIRVTHRERLQLLWATWKNAGRLSIGRSAWFALVVRQTVQRSISFAYRWLGVGSAVRVEGSNP
jgi:glycosyltransferase involved in cell wall biosynthesis